MSPVDCVAEAINLQETWEARTCKGKTIKRTTDVEVSAMTTGDRRL